MSDLAPAAIGAEEARERLDRVKVNISAAAEDMTALYQGRAWVTLGFDSWDDLCDHELGGVRIALPRDQRREVVGQMRDAEMSAPAIGTALGVTHTTIRNDLKELSGSGRTFPDTVIGIDGRRRPAHVTTTTRTTETTEVEQDVDLDTGEIIDDGAAVAEFVESGADYRRAVLRRDLVAVVTKWRPPIGISPDEAAALDLDETTVGIIARAQQDLNDWIDKFTAARGTGLRVVNGGSR